MARRSHDTLHSRYRLRFLACLAGSLLVVVGVFEWGPRSSPTSVEAPTPHSRDRIELQRSVQPTRHRPATAPPPPPAPVPPIVHPETIELRQMALEVVNDIDVEEGPPARAGSGASSQTKAAEQLTGPRPLRFVEPEYTQAARQQEIHAAVKVEVTVDPQGRVKKARVAERLLNPRTNRERKVSRLGYGLEEAALAAARRFRFRPARRGGEPVSSTFTLTFSFGT